jgi:hypothetical protein
MSKFTIDFMNISPDTVKRQAAETTDISGVTIPADAMQFAFFDEDMKYVAPSYFVTDEIDFGQLEELQVRHQNASLHCDPKDEVKVALVSWTDEPGVVRKTLVPLFEFVAVVDRKSGKVVWPTLADCRL